MPLYKEISPPLVDLNPAAEPTTVDLNPSQAPAIPSPSRAKSLATRYKIALGDEEDTEQSLTDTILSGGEGQIQERLVQKDMASRKEAARSLVEESLMRESEVEVPAMAALADTGKPYDGSTMLSRAFVDKANDLYLNEVVEETGVLPQADDYMKEQDGIQAFSDHAKRQNYILEKKREIDDRIEQMGVLPWLDQQAMSMLEFPGWFNIVKNVPTEDDGNKWFVGGTLESTVTHILGLPLEEASVAINETVEKLTNGDSTMGIGNGSLLDARRFLEALQSYSSMDSIFDTGMNLSVLPVGSAFRAGKVAVKEFKGAQRIAAAQTKTAAAPAPPAKPAAPKGLVKDGETFAARANKPHQSFGAGYQVTKRADGKWLLRHQEEQGMAFRDVLDHPESGDIFGSQEEISKYIREREAKGWFSQVDSLNGEEALAWRKVGDEEALTPTQNGARAVNEAISQPHVEMADVVNASGRPMEGAKARLASLAEAVMPGAPEAAKAQFNQLVAKTGLLRPTVTGAEKLDSTLAVKLEAAQEAAISAAKKGLTSMRVARLTPDQELAAAELGQQKLVENKLKDTIDSVRAIHYIPSEYSATNVAHNVVLHSYADGELFLKPETASKYAKRYLGYKPNEFSVVKAGDKYIIEAMVPVDETGFFKLTPENTPKNNTWGMIKTMLAHPFGSKVFASTFQTQQRAAAAHGVNALAAAMKDLLKPIEALSRKERAALDKVMEVNRQQELIPGSLEKGMFYQSVPELEQAYLDVNKRLPTDQEIEGYFSAVYWSEVDYVFRSLNRYRDKASAGFSNISLRVDENGVWKDVKFEGKPSDASFLDSGHKINFVVMEGDGTRTIKKLNDISKEERDLYKERIAKGEFKVVQAHNPKHAQVLKAATGLDPIDLVKDGAIKKTAAVPYFLVPEFETHALDLAGQVGYKPGFHNKYRASHYVKQARVVDDTYDGDTTVLGASNEAKALEDAAAMEKGRVLLKKIKEGDLSLKTALDDHLANTLGIDTKRFDSLFEKHLDINQPFIVVKDGEKSMNTKNRFMDGRSFNEAYENANVDLDTFHNPNEVFGDVYSANRDPDLMEVSRGTDDNPLINFETADQFSPLMVQAQSMSELIKSTLFNDYQITAANNYIETFAKDLRYNGQPISPDDLRRNPVYFMSRAEIDPKTNPKRALQAYQLRKAVLNLIGTPSAVARWVDAGKQHMMSALYKSTGEKYFEYIPDIMIPAITDPFQFLRSVAFHSKLGLFNPVQFFVQGASVMTMHAISPMNAFRSYGPSVAMRTLHLTEDPKIIEAAADQVAKLNGGMSKDEFLEAYNGLRMTRFDAVGGEYAWKSSSVAYKMFTNGKGQKFLDKGAFFFNAGERALRLTGWNTAYLDYLKKNPKKLGKMNRDDFQKIQNRAQAYVGNMTRDNNSLWQTGILGNFSQFASYNVRQVELMLGKELSTAERSRLFLGHATMYGFAPAAGVVAYSQTGDTEYLTKAATSVNPFAEDMALFAKKKGLDMHDGLIGALYDGVVASMTESAFGERQDVAGRYGLSVPKVWEAAQKNYDRENPVWATIITLMGPSGSIFNDILTEGKPLTKDLIELAMGEGPPSEYLIQDMENLLKELTSVTVFSKIQAIINSKPYRTQAGNLGITTDPEAAKRELAKVLLGLTSQEDSDAFKMGKDITRMKDDRLDIKKEVQKRMTLAIDARREGREEDYFRLRKEAMILLDAGGFPPGRSRIPILFPGGAPTEMYKDAITKEWLDTLSSEQRVKAKEID